MLKRMTGRVAVSCGFAMLTLAVTAPIRGASGDSAEAAEQIHLGSGVKVGEITDREAVVHVRLTAALEQDAEGRIRAARVRHACAMGCRNPAWGIPWRIGTRRKPPKISPLRFTCDEHTAAVPPIANRIAA